MLPLLFALFTPQVSGVDTNVALARLAIELAAQEPPPIPLDADGTNVHGVIYDRLRLGQLFARDATLRGKYLDQNSLAPLLQSAGSGVVPYPLICAGKPNL